MYSQKVVQSLKPGWYLSLPKKEKNKLQRELKEEHENSWKNKPELLKSGTPLVAKDNYETITKDKTYYVSEHCCSLVTTIYGSTWNEFVIIKNDFGRLVKLKLSRFLK